MTATEVIRETTDTLSKLVRRELVCVSASMKNSDSDIKLARAYNYLDVLQLLSLPISVFLQAANGDKPHDLHVAVDQTQPQSITKNNALTTLMAASKPSKSLLTTNFTVEVVPEVQVGYQNAPNKETFLKTYATDSCRKPSIDDQIEAVVVDMLSENNLLYTDGCGGENKAMVEKAL